MSKPQDHIPLDHIVKASAETKLLIPFFSYYVPAGFASPAESHIERVCDLNDLCITNKEASYFVRASGDSMMEEGLGEGDVMVVDRSITDYEGRIVVVWLNGGYTVKRFHKGQGLIALMPANPDYQPIYVQDGDDCRVFGVVTYWIKKALIKKVFEL